MNIREYFEKLNNKSQLIFHETLSDIPNFGGIHNTIVIIFEFSKSIKDKDERALLSYICSLFESSCLSLLFGLYRQSLSSLRLAFEVGLGLIYFSANKLEHQEWLQGKSDINWSSLIDLEKGVLSKRFSNAFYPELSGTIEEYNTRARKVYRELSEFVHGNMETWKESGISLSKNDPLISKYFNSFKEISEILMFSLACRYLNNFTPEQLDDNQSFTDELKMISSIRKLAGGPKDIV